MNNLRNKVYVLLRLSEKWFKTDMVYLAKGGFWLTLTQVISAASAFILSVVFAHFFSREDFGNYKYVIAVAGIISTFSLTGLGTAVTQSVARGYEGALKEGFKEYMKWSLPMVLISIGASVYYYIQGNTFLAISLLIIAATTSILSAGSLYNPYLSGKKDFRHLTWLTAFRNLFPTILLIAVLFINPNPYWLVLTYFLGHSVAAYICYRFTLYLYKPSQSSDLGMLSYAKHLSLLSILNTIADQIDKVIVFHYVGAAELAVYTFATAIPMQLKGVLKGIYQLALPKFANREAAALKSELPSKMFRFFLAIVPVVIFYILIAPYVYKIFFPRYLDAINMSRIFSFSLLGFISVIPSTYLQAQKVIRGLYGSNAVFAIVKILFLLIGVSLWGLWGVVIARTLYEFAGVIIVWIYASKTPITSLNEQQSPQQIN